MFPGEAMNGSAQNVGLRKKRNHATPAVAPITRAIRAALAVSATALALSVPGVGVAGTCAYDAVSNTYVCDGNFNQTVTDTFVPPIDLTLVLGGDVPSSVNPPAGQAGVDAAWAGNVSVIVNANATIGTTGADGIHAYSADAAAAIANYGSIHTNVTAFGVEALDIYAVDDVTLVNGGDVSAGDAIGSYNVIAANIVSGGGDITIDNQLGGSFTASAHGGDAIALSALVQGAYAALTISNDGVINADSVYGDAIGIRANGNEILVWNGGSIAAGGYTSAIGVDVSGNHAVVDNDGIITVQASSDGSYSYVPAIGVRSFATDSRVYNGEYGLISAEATTDSQWGWARARGVYAVGFDEGVTVENDGDIQAYARADNGRAEAHGIYAFGYGGATNVTNAGDIDVSARSDNGGAYATGINSIGYAMGDNDATVFNTGSIVARADAAYAYAFGVLNLTRQRYGSAYLTNDGDIHAEATGGYATATGTLNLALRYGDATTINTGDISAAALGDSGATATGLYNYALVYDAIVDNSGTVSASAIGDMAIAVGVYNTSSLYGATTTRNAGDVVVHASADTGFARAGGVVSMSQTSVDLTNYADIDVIAYAVDGPASASGLYAMGQQTVTVLNYGDVVALAESANGDAIAYGAYVAAGYAGIGLLINGDSLYASASAGAGSDARAIGAFVYADVATIFNDGSTAAVATSDGGFALAAGLGVYGMQSAINNYGDVTARATSDGGVASATGVDVFGYTASSFYNASTIGAYASADGGLATAIGAYSIGIFTAYATNNATISAEATGAQTVAKGLYNASVFDAITVNEGSISAVAEGTLAAYGEYEALAFGAYNLAVYYNSVIDNSGSISASASATTDISGTNGFLVAKALGAVALSQYGYGETVIANSGTITAFAETSQGYAGAWGAVSMSGVYGNASIENDYLISTYAHTDIGSADTIGAYVSTIAGTSTIVNYGDIVANARAERGIVNVSVNYADATGVAVFAPYGSGEATLANYGNIVANASVLGGIGYATGVQAYSTYTSINNAAGANIIATVDAELFGGAFALGVEAIGYYSVDVVNDGNIVAYGHANAFSEGAYGFYGAAGATGIYAIANVHGDAMVVNNGDITALAIAENSVSWAQGGAGAVGVHAYAKYDATIVNTSNITVVADAEFGNTGAYGVIAHGKYSSHIVNEAGASIVASASVGSLAGDQEAGRAVSFGTQTFGNGMEYALTYNAGDIISHAVVTPDGTEAWIGSMATAFGSTIGYNSGIASAALINLGSIEAAASADFGYASAYGAFVSTQYDSAITNSGDIRASASAAGGNAFAVGTYAFSLHQTVTYNCDPTGYYCDWANPIIDVDGGESLLDNSDDIIATASASGGVGYSYGAVVIGGYAAGINNAGHISAITNADDALAVGSLANSFEGDALLQNSGSGIITAVATGDIANASGAVLLGYLNTEVDNAGTILAAAYGADATATAVSMDSNGNNVLTNTGTIAALGDGTRIAIASGSGATSIANSGSIIGAILTGDLDDNLDNAAGSIWHAVGETDFGAGDDHIVNHGTIFMDDAVIRLGGYTNGNTFDNFGTLAVSGAANVLDMDNPFPVNNNGVITFVDGAADDVLTIVGDFAGQGAIHVDVSGLNQSGDQLYIEGSVIEPTAQTLNVNLLDMPTTASMYVPLVYVNGDSTADDFVLGNVGYGGGFLSLDLSLNVNIDASNATADVFSLGVTVTGLSDAGSLAANLAPGAQSLVNAQVGTWRQRMGVVPGPGKSGLAPWVRMFTDSGNVNPQHSSNFGPGGNFGFDQSNHGWELGLDARPTENFAVGVLFADSDGSQHLRAGAGSNRFDGKTFGLYGTLMGSGFYVDVSQRWTGLDARVESGAGTQTTEVSANAFNVEAGYTAWTVADIHVVPQVQYTRTEVSDISMLEIGQSTFVVDGGVSSRGRLGVAIDKTFERAGYTWTPYGSLNAVREFKGEYDYSVNGGLLGATNTEGTSAMVELGLGMRKGKLSITGGVNWIDGGAVQSFMGGQLSMRYSW